MVTLPFELEAVLPFLLGKKSGTSSQDRFSLMTMHLAGGVADLDFFTNWASCFITIFYDIATKGNKNYSMNKL